MSPRIFSNRLAADPARICRTAFRAGIADAFMLSQVAAGVQSNIPNNIFQNRHNLICSHA